MAEQYRAWGGILYPDSESYDCGLRQLAVKSVFDRYGFILHDKDVYTDEDEKKDPKHKAGTLKKPHLHWVGYCASPKTINGLAALLGWPKNELEKWTSWKKAVRYLIHLDNKDRYQYLSSDIFDYNFPLDSLLNNASYEAEEAKLLLEHIWSGQVVSLSNLGCWAMNNNCWSTFRRNYSFFKDAWKEYCEERR